MSFQPKHGKKKTCFNWINAARYVFNQCLASVKSGVPLDRKKLRELHVNDAVVADRPWLAKIPYDIRDSGLSDLIRAVNICKEVYANNGKVFNPKDMKFRKKNDPQSSVTIPSKKWEYQKGMANGKRWKEDSIYKFLQRIKTEVRILDLKYDARLVRTRLGKYFLCVPMQAYAGQNQACNKVVALDPGVRTFQTTFDTDGLITKWGDGSMSRIFRLCYRYDKLVSKMSGLNHKQARNMHRASLRITTKIKNRITDLHRRTAKWLCLNYNLIYLPEFKTSQMVNKHNRKLNSKSARAMMTLAHYRFRECIKNKSKHFTNCKVVICTEEYTTKTCGKCGNMYEIDGAKTYICKKCDYKADRDANGSRNILLKEIIKSDLVEGGFEAWLLSCGDT